MHAAFRGPSTTAAQVEAIQFRKLFSYLVKLDDFANAAPSDANDFSFWSAKPKFGATCRFFALNSEPQSAILKIVIKHLRAQHQNSN